MLNTGETINMWWGGGGGVWGQLHEGLRKVTFANTIESKCTSVSGRLWRQLHEGLGKVTFANTIERKCTTVSGRYGASCMRVWERSPLQTL